MTSLGYSNNTSENLSQQLNLELSDVDQTFGRESNSTEKEIFEKRNRPVFDRGPANVNVALGAS